MQKRENLLGTLLKRPFKEEQVFPQSLSLHSTQELMLESEQKHAAKQTLKAMRGTECFTPNLR